MSEEKQIVEKGELFAQLLIQQLGRNHDTSSFIQLRLFLLERHYESREVSSRWLIRRLFKTYSCQYPINCIKDFQCSMTSRIKSLILVTRLGHLGTWGFCPERLWYNTPCCVHLFINTSYPFLHEHDLIPFEGSKNKAVSVDVLTFTVPCTCSPMSLHSHILGSCISVQSIWLHPWKENNKGVRSLISSLGIYSTSLSRKGLL